MKIGTYVTAPGYLYRNRDLGNRREWKKRPYVNNIKGFYIGWRIYQNGKIIYNDEEGNEFIPDEYIKIALIVVNERENPIPILYSEMRELIIIV